MQKNCAGCAQQFDVSDADLKFYDRISPVLNGKKYPIPTPGLCPRCRVQRRHTWRNEYTLYARTCDMCGKKIISIYDTDAVFPVYCSTCWWSDKWDALDFGLEYDFSKTFFKNYLALQRKVPRMGIWNHTVENSEYTNHSSFLKNCYLLTTSIHVEDGFYSRWVVKCRDIADCYQIANCELTYETLYSDGTYNNVHTYCSDSQECKFTYDCRGCTDLFMCHNLRQKKYCIENVQYTKEEYQRRMNQINLGSYKEFSKYYRQYLYMIQNKAIREHVRLSMCENSSGEMMYKCKNTHDSFGTMEAEDSRYCHEAVGIKDCYDACEGATAELLYETSGCDDAVSIIAGNRCSDINNSFYIDGCLNSSSLFGCIGLNRKKYCVLNKQYTKEEYEALIAKIVEKMIADGEWGEYFPVSASTFGYNETIAMEDFPLTKEEVSARGWKWKEIKTSLPVPQTFTIADDIKDVPDQMTKEILACIECGKNYKIIGAELSLYRKLGIPVPRKCAACRRADRNLIRSPIFKLMEINCSKCGEKTITSDNPYLPQKIYCEKCYLEAVY